MQVTVCRRTVRSDTGAGPANVAACLHRQEPVDLALHVRTLPDEGQRDVIWWKGQEAGLLMWITVRAVRLAIAASSQITNSVNKFSRSTSTSENVMVVLVYISTLGSTEIHTACNVAV